MTTTTAPSPTEAQRLATLLDACRSAAYQSAKCGDGGMAHLHSWLDQMATNISNDGLEVAEACALLDSSASEIAQGARRMLSLVRDMVAAAGHPSEDLATIARAQERNPSELGTDDLKVDDDAVVSTGEGGAWVQAWVWVPES